MNIDLPIHLFFVENIVNLGADFDEKLFYVETVQTDKSKFTVSCFYALGSRNICVSEFLPPFLNKSENKQQVHVKILRFFEFFEPDFCS